MSEHAAAAEWEVESWFNTAAPLALADLRGRVVYVIAFQMLCPGCAGAALPQALKLRAAFAERDLVIVGLHTVFEHHAAQGSRAALAAFLQEYGIDFPVGVDAAAAPGELPATMRTYEMQGTPTSLLIDRAGYLRLSHFGHLDDMRLAAAVATLVAERGETGAGA